MDLENLIDKYTEVMNRIGMDLPGRRIIIMIVHQKESHIQSLINWLEESKETDFNKIVRKAVEITKD